MTKILSGVKTPDDVRFYIYFLKQFHSQYNPNKIGPGFGNRDLTGDTDYELIALREAYQNCPPSSPDLLFEITAILNDWTKSGDLMDELIGIWGDEYNLIRVFESVQVYHLPAEGKNVTGEFQS